MRRFGSELSVIGLLYVVAFLPFDAQVTLIALCVCVGAGVLSLLV